MPKPALTVEQTVEVELAPEVAQFLRAALENYDEWKAKFDKAEIEKKAASKAIQEVLDIVGTKSFRFEGRMVSLVEGTTSYLDEKKLLALGVTLAQIHDATVTVPKKAYAAVGKAKS